MLQFRRDLSNPGRIPLRGMVRAWRLMRKGRLHRYGEASSNALEVREFEQEYAAYMGSKYCVALNSCGCALFIALKTVGVKPGDKVLVNAFTLAPVPGAVAHCGAQPVLIEINEDYLIDLDDFAEKAKTSGAKVLLLSHMRGHIANMEELVAICEANNITLIEDCAHTMGARWNGQLTGTFGKVGCFSTQTFKHINSGEGGILVTDDPDVAAQATLFSGSYMLYDQHGARPSDEVFAKWKTVTPNFSMRMSNMAAAVLRPQLKRLDSRAQGWNQRYQWMEEQLETVPHLRLPKRDPREGYVASSIQFNLVGLSPEEMQTYQANCAERGVFLKWFGNVEAVGFTSSHRNWEYMENEAELPATDDIMQGLFDMRIPLSLNRLNAIVIGRIMREEMEALTGVEAEVKFPIVERLRSSIADS